MAYVLPRLFIAAIGWGFTCVAIWIARSGGGPMAFCYAGAAWGMALIGYVRTMRKLRREFQELRLANVELKASLLRMAKPASQPAMSWPARARASAVHPLDRAA